MPTPTVHVESFREPLQAVRRVLDGADEAFWASRSSSGVG